MDQYNVSLTDTITTDLVYFSGKFIEKGFITRKVSSDILGMYGVGGSEKAENLLNKVVANLNITQDKKKWFRDFVAIFSVEAAYKPLADQMVQTYRSGLLITTIATHTQMRSSPLRSGLLITTMYTLLHIHKSDHPSITFSKLFCCSPHSPTAISHPATKRHSPTAISHPATKRHSPTAISHPATKRHSPTAISHPATKRHSPTAVSHPATKRRRPTVEGV